MRWKRTAALTVTSVVMLGTPVAAATGVLGGFADVPATSSHAAAVHWLAENGISQGCAPQLFCPQDAVSREHMATFLKRLAEAGIVDAATVEGLTAAQLKGQTGPVGPAGETGPVGATGAKGATGAAGPQGATGLQGESGPQGEIGPHGKTGLKGDTGATGADGSTVLGLGGVPDADLGRVGDFYLDTTHIDFYGPKTADGWGTGVSLIGRTGEKGDTGATGLKGDIGAPGATGLKGDTGATGLKGDPGEKGQPGLDGRTWHTGDVAPPDALGQDGDLYLNTTTHTYFGPKAQGHWPTSGTSLVGPAGEAGGASSVTTTIRHGWGQGFHDVHAVAYCEDGEVAVGGGYDVKGWDMTTHEPVQPQVRRNAPMYMGGGWEVSAWLPATTSSSTVELSAGVYAVCVAGTSTDGMLG